MEEGDLPDGIEKITTEAQQIGAKILKVSFVEYVGRRKKTTRIEVKESELDEMLKQEDGPLTYQLNMF